MRILLLFSLILVSISYALPINNELKPIPVINNSSITSIPNPDLKSGQITTQLSRWIILNIQTLCSYDYKNYAAKFALAKQSFMDNSWTSYMKYSEAPQILKEVIDNKSTLSVKILVPPYLIVEAPFRGTYMWKYGMSVLLTFHRPDNKTYSRKYNILIFIQRQPPGAATVKIYQLALIDAQKQQQQEKKNLNQIINNLHPKTQ